MINKIDLFESPLQHRANCLARESLEQEKVALRAGESLAIKHHSRHQ